MGAEGQLEQEGEEGGGGGAGEGLRCGGAGVHLSHYDKCDVVPCLCNRHLDPSLMIQSVQSHMK